MLLFTSANYRRQLAAIAALRFWWMCILLYAFYLCNSNAPAIWYVVLQHNKCGLLHIFYRCIWWRLVGRNKCLNYARLLQFWRIKRSKPRFSGNTCRAQRNWKPDVGRCVCSRRRYLPGSWDMVTHDAIRGACLGVKCADTSWLVLAATQGYL